MSPKLALFLKALFVGLVALVLLIPLGCIHGLVQERNARREAVQKEIAASSAGQQRLCGPMLVVSYRVNREKEVRDEKTGTVHKEIVAVWEHRTLLPRQLRIQGTAKVDERHRGLYKSQLYTLKAQLEGSFEIPEAFGITDERGQILSAKAFVHVGLSDMRGLNVQPRLDWGGRQLGFQAGRPVDALPLGLFADLGPAVLGPAREVAFSLPLEFTGSQHLAIAPLGEETIAHLESDWPSPSFAGDFLPRRHQIGEQGFKADWHVTSLSRDPDNLPDAKADGQAFSVAFLEPVNVYLMSERAVKYGALFVVCTFAAFLLIELVRRVRIHPVQYALVGSALALFFLLLFSLSEHISFGLSYLAAGGASLVLLGGYLAHVLRSARNGWTFTAGLGLLYGALYGLLQSEDNALLLGALLLFGLVGALMFFTRRLDWYRLGNSGGGEDGEEGESQA